MTDPPITVQQRTTFDGVLLHVTDGGTLMMLAQGGACPATFAASRSLAAELTRHVFQAVRLHGIGRWTRDDRGAWRLVRMDVEWFEVPCHQQLHAAVAALRALPVEWPADIEATLRAERADD